MYGQEDGVSIEQPVPLWVKIRHFATRQPCPLAPDSGPASRSRKSRAAPKPAYRTTIRTLAPSKLRPAPANVSLALRDAQMPRQQKPILRSLHRLRHLILPSPIACCCEIIPRQ